MNNPPASKGKISQRRQEPVSNPARRWTCAAGTQELFEQDCAKAQCCGGPTISKKITDSGRLRMPISSHHATQNQTDRQEKSGKSNPGSKVPFLRDRNGDMTPKLKQEPKPKEASRSHRR